MFVESYANEKKHPAAAAYLRRYMDALRESEHLKEHLEFLREQSTSLQRTMDGMPRGSSGRDKMAAVVSGIVDEEAAIVEKIAHVHEVRREVTQCIERYPVERERRVLFMLYVQGLTHDETADRLNRCASTVRRDANKAITYIEEHCADALRAAGYLPKQGEEAA